MEFLHFIGVDVSKNELDFAVFEKNRFLFHKEITNKKESINRLFKELKKIDQFSLNSTLVCMEHTGIYNLPLVYYLKEKNANIWLEPGSRINYFYRSERGKNDKIDSIRIGEYSYINRDRLILWRPKRTVLTEIEKLISLRDRLIKSQISLKNPLSEFSRFYRAEEVNVLKFQCSSTLNAIKADVKRIENAIHDLIVDDASLNRLYNIITSVKGIGPLTAIQILICSNEFRSINDPKKFACHAGVAPFIRESGLFRGKGRVSKMSNSKLRTLIHMSALNAIRYNPELKSYYDRKVEEGKNKMTVINAVRNKLIHRVFACVKSGKQYDSNYRVSSV